MKKTVLLATVVLLAAAGFAQAAEAELHGTVDFTYLSKYVWRGFSIYGHQGAIQPSIDLNLYNTGFGIDVAAHRATSGGHAIVEDGERWDYTLYYQNMLFNDEVYATQYRLSYVYYNFPEFSSHTRNSIDLQELNGAFSWPKLLGIKGLVPSYVLVKMWPSNGDSPVSQATGFAHIFMLDYGLNIGSIIPDAKEQILNLHAEVIYNDGVDPRPNGPGVDHDWSDAVFGVSTGFEVAKNLTFTPGIYHQVSMDKSVNNEKHLTWASAGLSYKF